MTNNLTIVRAVYSGLSQRQAAATHQVSRNTVALLLRHAKAQGWLTLEDLSHLDNAAFSKALVKSTRCCQWPLENEDFWPRKLDN